MSASQDAALIVENNLPSQDAPTYDDFDSPDANDSEDPAGHAGQSRHDHARRGLPSGLRPSERPPVPAPKRPALLPPDLAPPRVALQRLTPATRTRDRDILRPGRDAK